MRAKDLIIFFSIFLLTNNRLLAEETLPPDQSLWQTLVMIGIAFLFFYLILWRPEQKRRRAIEEQRNALKKGDRVAAMGIIGTVLRVGEQTVILKMYDGSKIEFYRAAISEILPEVDESQKKVELISEE